MSQQQQASRNERIFRKVLEGVPYREIAQEHQVTETRIDQIFKQEAKQRLPAIYDRVPAGRGYPQRFLEVMKAQGAQS